MRRPGSGRQIWPPCVSPANVTWKSPGAVEPDHPGVVGEQQAQAPGAAVQLRQHRRQVVVAAVGVVDPGHLHHGPARSTVTASLVSSRTPQLATNAGSVGPHERRLAVAVVVVAEHAEHAQARMEAQELPAELVQPCAAAGEVAGDHTRSGRAASARSTALRVARRLRLGVKPDVEVGELHHGEAVERRVGVRRRQAPVHAAHPLGLVQQIGETEGGGPDGRGRRPQPVAREPVQLTSSGAVPAGPP